MYAKRLRKVRAALAGAMYALMWISMNIHMHVCIYVCVYVCTYVFLRAPLRILICHLTTLQLHFLPLFNENRLGALPTRL